MNEDEGRTRAEALMTLVGALLVGALTVYAAWSSARRNETLGAEQAASIRQAAHARGGGPHAP